MDYIEKLLEQVLGSPKRAGGDELVYHCPFCQDRVGDSSSKPKLHVNLDKQMVHCFRCEYKKATLLPLLLDLGINRKDINLQKLKSKSHTRGSTLADTVDMTLKKEDGINPNLYMISLPEGYKPLVGAGSWFARRAISYLNKRGITNELIEKHRIGYTMEGKYSKMIIFPVIYRGSVVYFTTRGVGSDTRVLNPSEDECPLGKSHWLFNYDEACKHDTVIVVESVIDAMTVGENAVGLLGKAISNKQFSLLSKCSASRITIMLDDDAHNDTYKVSHRFMGIKEVSIVLLEGGDPNKLRDSIHQIIEKSAAAPTTSGRVGAILRKAK